jgi:uncharacterized membrane protein
MTITAKNMLRPWTLARTGIGAKECLIGVLLLILVTDIFIVLDVVFLRQFLGFITYAFLPGALILYMLRMRGMSIVKRLVLSFSLSLAFLMLVGLLIDVVLPAVGIDSPLAMPPLVISFSIIMALMAVLAYQRNKADFGYVRLPALRTEEEKQFAFPIALPILFPLLSVLGTRLMDSGGSNVLSIIFYLLIPAYVVLLIWQRKRIPKVVFPLSISMISLAILLARGMTSNFIIGGDVYSEYETSLFVSNSLQWHLYDIPTTLASLNFCLGIGLLLPVLQSLLGVTTMIIYKVIAIVLISVVPLIGYLIYEKHIGQLYAFLAAVFVMAQIPFIYLLTGQIRVGIAIVFFASVVLVLFDKDMGKLNRSILLLVFEVCIIAAYYVTPVIVFFLLLVVWLVPIIANATGHKWHNVIGGWNVVFVVVLIFVWWGQVTDAAFNGYVQYVQNTIENLSQMFVPEMRGGEITTILGGATGLPQQIAALLNDICFGLIALGIFFCLRIRKWRDKVDRSYTFMMLAAMVPLTAAIVLPYVSLGYAGDRLFVQVLPVLAPAFIIGCATIAGFIQNKLVPTLKPKLDLALVGVLLVGLFVCNTFLLYYFMGVGGTEVFDRESERYTILYVYDDEISAANWLDEHNIAERKAYINRITQMSTSVFLFTSSGRERTYEVMHLTAEALISDSDMVLFFRRPAYSGITVYTAISQIPITHWIKDYEPTVDYRDKIYTTGGTEIYK